MRRPPRKLSEGRSRTPRERSGWAVLLAVLVSGAPGSLWPARAAAQVGASQVRGIVLDGDLDVPLAGAEVRIEGRPEAPVVYADSEGAFTLLVPVDLFGPAWLVVSAPDFEPQRVALDSSAPIDDLVVHLEFAAGDTPASTASATRPEAETASSVRVSSRDIFAAPRRTAEDALQQVPGLTLVQHGSEGKGHQFFLRGFDAIHGADLEVTVGGVPVNEWSNIHAQGYLDLTFVIPELIRRVDVTKGPYLLEQGAFAMAGSAAYRLGVAPEDRGWRVGYTVGTTNRHRLFLGFSPADGDGEDFVGVEAVRDDGYGAARAVERYSALGRVGLARLGADGHLAAWAGASGSRFELPGTLRLDDWLAGRVPLHGSYDPTGRGDGERVLVALDLERPGADGLLRAQAYGGFRALDLRENFTGYLIDPERGDRREQEHLAWSFGLRTGGEWTPSAELAFVGEAGLRGDRIAQREDAVNDALQRVSRRRELEATQLLVHAAAGLRWTPSDSVRLDAGARVDVVDVATEDGLVGGAAGGDTLVAASPRVSLRWSAAAAVDVFAAYGRGFRPPEARGFSSFDAEREGIGEEVLFTGDPAATVADATELGLRLRPWENVLVGLSGFATLIERESIFDHVSGVNLELNGTRRLGGELTLAWEPLSWLRLEGDATLVDARFRGSGNRVPLAPWLAGGLRVTMTDPGGWRAGLRLLGVASRTLPHDAQGDPLIEVDATLGYHWSAFRLDLEVENLLDRETREGEYHYASHWRRGEAASQIPVTHFVAGAPLNARLTLSALF